MVVTSPIAGVTAAAMGLAIESGSATIATVSPAMALARSWAGL
jgi:hypothetical protein